MSTTNLAAANVFPVPSVSARIVPDVDAPQVQVPHVVRKLSAGTLAASTLKRVLHPGHLWRAAHLHYHRKANRRKYDDTRLALYARILPSDFLHYGYFDELDRLPEQMSLADITRAQERYAEQLIELVGAPDGPVLDVGCGMGGLTRMLQAQGFTPVALTPDRMQAQFVAKSVPQATVIRSKFEALPTEENAHRFGAVVTAESLQYLKLDKALTVMDAVLKPGGKWVACDYFLTTPSTDKTCHNWNSFNEKLTQAGWTITYQRDITPNVLPTLAFLHMMATRFGLPLIDFVDLRFRRKQPGLHHLFEGMLTHVEDVAADNVGLINPDQFARDRQYMMLKIERTRDAL